MNIYSVSCHSLCGTYSDDYLQSLTVSAESEQDAIVVARNWMKTSGNRFVEPETHWRVWLLVENAVFPGVVSAHFDSDY